MQCVAGRVLEPVDIARLAAIAFLHDVGKLHPGFQAKGWADNVRKPELRDHLTAGWAFFDQASIETAHPFSQTLRIVSSWGKPETIGALVAAMFAHYGRPVARPNTNSSSYWDFPGPYDWRAEAGRFDRALRDWFAPAFAPGGSPLPDSAEFHHFFAGFLALADWIGSDRQFFGSPTRVGIDRDQDPRRTSADGSSNARGEGEPS